MKVEEIDRAKLKTSEKRMWIEVKIGSEWVMPRDLIEYSGKYIYPTEKQLNRYDGIRMVIVELIPEGVGTAMLKHILPVQSENGIANLEAEIKQLQTTTSNSEDATHKSCNNCGAMDGYDCRTCIRCETPDIGKPLQDHWGLDKTRATGENDDRE